MSTCSQTWPEIAMTAFSLLISDDSSIIKRLSEAEMRCGAVFRCNDDVMETKAHYENMPILYIDFSEVIKIGIF